MTEPTVPQTKKGEPHNSPSGELFICLPSLTLYHEGVTVSSRARHLLVVEDGGDEGVHGDVHEAVLERLVLEASVAEERLHPRDLVVEPDHGADPGGNAEVLGGAH